MDLSIIFHALCVLGIIGLISSFAIYCEYGVAKSEKACFTFGSACIVLAVIAKVLHIIVENFQEVTL